MAIYQFVIELIPTTGAIDKKNRVEELYEDDFYDLSVVWKSYQLTIDLQSSLSQMLPQGKSWNEKLRIWGDDKRSDIQLRLEDQGIEGIKIRLDLRDDIEDLNLGVIE